jgi:hypothetical protein
VPGSLEGEVELLGHSLGDRWSEIRLDKVEVALLGAQVVEDIVERNFLVENLNTTRRVREEEEGEKEGGG